MPPPPKTTLPPRTPTTGTSLSKEEKTSPEKTTSSNELATSKAGGPTTASGTRAVEGAEAGRPGARAARLNLDTVTSALANTPPMAIRKLVTLAISTKMSAIVQGFSLPAGFAFVLKAGSYPPQGTKPRAEAPKGAISIRLANSGRS